MIDPNNPLHAACELGPCTIFGMGEFGFMFSREARSVTIELAPYAQYPLAVHVRFVPKGARKPRGFVKYEYSTKGIDLVIAKGHGYPEPKVFTDPKVENGIVASESRFSSFEEGMFTTLLGECLKGREGEIVKDYR